MVRSCFLTCIIVIPLNYHAYTVVILQYNSIYQKVSSDIITILRENHVFLEFTMIISHFLICIIGIPLNYHTYTVVILQYNAIYQKITSGIITIPTECHGFGIYRGNVGNVFHNNYSKSIANTMYNTIVYISKNYVITITAHLQHQTLSLHTETSVLKQKKRINPHHTLFHPTKHTNTNTA